MPGLRPSESIFREKSGKLLTGSSAECPATCAEGFPGGCQNRSEHCSPHLAAHKCQDEKSIKRMREESGQRCAALFS